jgi:hypothetical protein
LSRLEEIKDDEETSEDRERRISRAKAKRLLQKLDFSKFFPTRRAAPSEPKKDPSLEKINEAVMAFPYQASEGAPPSSKSASFRKPSSTSSQENKNQAIRIDENYELPAQELHPYVVQPEQHQQTFQRKQLINRRKSIQETESQPYARRSQHANYYNPSFMTASNGSRIFIPPHEQTGPQFQTPQSYITQQLYQLPGNFSVNNDTTKPPATENYQRLISNCRRKLYMRGNLNNKTTYDPTQAPGYLNLSAPRYPSHFAPREDFSNLEPPTLQNQRLVNNRNSTPA